MNSISVVIPVYNSSAILPDLLVRLDAVLEKLNCKYELILVNDGSKDQSWETILDLRAKYHFITGFNLTRNYGQHNALLCGIRAARCDVIVTIDDDLQHQPEEIPKLIEKLNEGFDVVYGTPQEGQHTFLRLFASRITKIALQTTMGVVTARKVSPFRAFNTRIRDAFQNYSGSFVSIDVLLTWGTKNFASVESNHQPRLKGSSNYTFRKLFTHAVNMVTGFSVLPLQFASLLGFTFTLLGILTLIFVIVNYLIRGGGVPGFSFLASIVMIFSGTQLFVLGIMGEYMARMHFRIMDRPPYVVRENVQGLNDMKRDNSEWKNE